MNRKFKILAVAPYESLKEVLLQTAKEYPQLDVTVEVGPIYEGLKKLQKYDLSQFDAVLSRGGTKMEIEKHTNLPVFEIPISYFDLLNIIKLVEHYQGKIAILTYESIANAARVLCDLLHFPYNIFIINAWHNAKEKVLQLKEQGYTLIIGDAVSVIQAEKLGIQSILLTSSADSVREAFSHICKVCSYIEAFQVDAHLLQGAGGEEHHAADHPAHEQRPPVFRGRTLSGRGGAPFPPQDDRQQGDAAQREAYRVEGQGPHMVHAPPLGHEGHAPDQRRQGEEQAAPDLSGFHGVSGPSAENCIRENI